MSKQCVVWMSVVLLLSCLVEASDSLKIITFEPSSPATLDAEERVVIKVDYALDSADWCRIFVRPYTRGKRSGGYGAHPSPQFDKGKGEMEGWFRFTDNAVVDEIRVDMRSPENKLLATASLPVRLVWKGGVGVKKVDPGGAIAEYLKKEKGFEVPSTVQGILELLDETTEHAEIGALISGLVPIGGPDAEDAIIAQLGEKRTHAFFASKALEGLSVERAYGPLTNLFWKCEARGWRDGANHAAKAIGNTKASGAYDMLNGVLEIKEGFYSHPYVRSGAAIGLGHLGDSRAVSELNGMVEEGDRAEYGAAEALSMLGATESADILIEAFQDRNRSRGCRAAHVKTLSDFNDRRCIPIFIDELKWDMEHPDAPRLQKEIEEINSHNSKYFAEEFVIYRLRRPLVDALIKFDDPQATEVIGDCLIQSLNDREKMDEMGVLINEPAVIEFMVSQGNAKAEEYLIRGSRITSSSEKNSIFKFMYERAVKEIKESRSSKLQG